MTVAAPASVSDLLAAAIAARVTPGGVIAVGTSTGPGYLVASGHHTYAVAAPAVAHDTIYDLASLTKVLATTALALQAHTSGALPLDAVVVERIPELTALGDATVRDLLEHTAGFAAHRSYYRAVAGRRGYLTRLAIEPMAYPLRTTHVYSDLGLILLAVLLEDATGHSFAAQFIRLRDVVAPGAEIALEVPAAWRPRIAPTGVDAWRGRVVAGHVHDDNAAALGGATGHAGLFGTADAVADFARWWLHLLRGSAPSTSAIPPALAQRAVSRGAVPGSSRGLGWDTMLPTSSCGTRMSARAFGHTGFTGTSLWIDPARDLYVVLLTNRVHANDDVEGIRRLRIAVHDAVIDAWDASAG